MDLLAARQGEPRDRLALERRCAILTGLALLWLSSCTVMPITLPVTADGGLSSAADAGMELRDAGAGDPTLDLDTSLLHEAGVGDGLVNGGDALPGDALPGDGHLADGSPGEGTLDSTACDAGSDDANGPEYRSP